MTARSSRAWWSACLCLLGACGRLGFELQPEQQARASAQENASDATRPSDPVDRAVGPMDSGTSAITTAPQIRMRDAGHGEPPIANEPPASSSPPSPPTMSGTGDAANGAACSADAECASGACVGTICCEHACDEPPQCHTREGTSCTDGVSCSYPATPFESCDDDNSCTEGDLCFGTACVGRSRNCDDMQACTTDFCSAGACRHASSCDPSGGECTYAVRERHGYWLCPMGVSFTDARSECERLSAYVVTINDRAEQDYLWSLGMRDTWIGYTTAAGAADGGFGWLSGPSDYSDWADGQPDNDAGEACAYLSAAAGGTWRSHDCNAAGSGFACEIEHYVPPDAGCTYARFWDHGYFICDSARDFWDAQRHCGAIGTTLAEIGDPLEQTFLRTQLRGDAKYTIGLHDIVTEGQFISVSGGAVTYFAWGDGQPANDDPGRDFVAITAGTGAWQTVTADEHPFFICEEPPERP